MAVTITTTNPQPTWLRAGGYEWANQVGTWAAPAPVTIVELDSTHSLNVSEDNTTNFLKSLVETLGTVDSLNTTTSFLKGFADSFTTVDSLNNTTSFLKDFAETLDTVDSLNTTTNFLKDFAETLGTVDSLNTTISFLRGFAEGLAVAESFGNHTAKPFADSFTTVSALGPFSFTKSIFETLTTLSPQTWRDNSDDTWATQPGTWASNFYYPAGEVHFDPTVEYLRGFTEGFTTVDSEKNSSTKNILETLDIVDSLSYTAEFLRDFAENFDSDTGYGHNFILEPIVEAFSVTDLQTNNTLKSFENSLDISELLVKDTTRPFSEAFQFSEVFGAGQGFYQYFEESIGILDTLRSHVGIEFSEAEWFSIIDMATTGAKGTLSDMAIYNDAIESLEDFEDLVLNGRIPGYGEFKNYIQGNYTYQKALIRAILDSTTPAGRVELSAMKIEVDLPDVIERGSVFIEGIAGATVTYNKIFKIIPELTLSVKGGAAGEVLIPEVTSKSLTGFTIKLKNVGTGLYVPGTISWAAHGY